MGTFLDVFQVVLGLHTKIFFQTSAWEDADDFIEVKEFCICALVDNLYLIGELLLGARVVETNH